MRKHALGLDAIPAPARPRGLTRTLVGLGLVVGGAPFLYEGILICVGNWQTAMGRSADVRTPFLDVAVYHLGRLRDDLDGMVMPWFQHVPWQPSYVLLAAGAVMVVSMLMLKR